MASLLRPVIDAEEWVLEGLHRLGLGWGLAIVALTVVVRLALVPLVVRQIRAARELRRHLPQINRLQKQHARDRARLQRELAEYYRRHGINPLGAIVPALVQVPIVISLYYVMTSDVRSGLFGDAGFLFVPHLADHPHGAVLAALLVAYLGAQLASSLVATRTLSGGHRWFMLTMPLLFATVVPSAPAGLAVYWVTTGVWSLGQQLVIWRLAPAR
jgi:YidC/Oxa1 family membrane protein insertase